MHPLLYIHGSIQWRHYTENTKQLLCTCCENWTHTEVAILGADQKERGLLDPVLHKLELSQFVLSVAWFFRYSKWRLVPLRRSDAVTSWDDETTSGKDDTTKTRRNEKLRWVHEELTRQVKMSIRSPHSHLRYLLYLRLLELQIMGMDLVSSVFQPFSVAVVWNCLHLLCKEDTCHFSVRSILRIRKKSGIRYKFCYSRLP